MKSEQDVAKTFSNWFSECNSVNDVYELQDTIRDMADQESENRLFELEN